MIPILTSLKSNVADAVAITNLVGTKCSLVIELQESPPPYIVYNVLELPTQDKDGTRDYEVTFNVVALTLDSLLTIYEALKTTVETNIGLANFQGTDFIDKTNKDDHFIIALAFNINI